MGTKITGLKPCPFCGSRDSQEFLSFKEYIMMYCTEEDAEYLMEDDEYAQTGGYLFCSATEGGCGSSTGFQHSMEAAIEAWETRKGI